MNTTTFIFVSNYSMKHIFTPFLVLMKLPHFPVVTYFFDFSNIIFSYPIKLKLKEMAWHFPLWLSPYGNFIMTNRSRGTLFSGSPCLLVQRYYLTAHLLQESELITWQSTYEPWHRPTENSTALRMSRPFQLADLCHFYWNVMKALNKSVRLKETYLSCSFNSILDSVSVQRGCHNKDW